MIRLLLIALFATALFAQPQLSFGPQVPSDLGASVEVRLSNSPAGMSALQFSVAAPVGAILTIVPGPSVTNQVVGKNMNCAVVLGKHICAVWGSLKTTVPDGVLATLNYTATKPVTVPVVVAETLGAALDGSAVVLGSGPGISLAIQSLQSRCDLTGDGKLDLADVLASIDQLQGKAACGAGDLNRDGLCNILDVQLVVNAVAPGGSCKFVP